MKGYGAVEMGVHRFFHPKSNTPTGEGRSIHLWQYGNTKMAPGKSPALSATIITPPRSDAAAFRPVEVHYMTCCAGHCAAAGFFDSRLAERDLRRYQRRGPAGSTRMLLAELRRSSLEGLHLLDVGSGIGVIPAELAAAGLTSVTLADASPAFLEVARRNVGSRYGSRPAQFILGDFTTTAATLPEADVVTLDRVVCCYPDPGALLSAAAAHSRRLLAFTFPRERWLIRAGFAVGNFIFQLRRNPFRIFVHSPQHMASVLEAAGSSGPHIMSRSCGPSTSTVAPLSKTRRKANSNHFASCS